MSSRKLSAASSSNSFEEVRLAQSVCQVSTKLSELTKKLARLSIVESIPIQAVERLIRVAYVFEAATGVRRGWGESPNASQIAVKTGLDRHVVSQVLRDQQRVLNIPKGRRDSISRVVQGWLSELTLPSGGLATGSKRARVDSNRTATHALIRKYAPGVSPRVVLDELLRRRLVVEQPGGIYRLTVPRGRPRVGPRVRKSRKTRPP
jgi:hypothetical protein